jgi:hypothetical protein
MLKKKCFKCDNDNKTAFSNSQWKHGGQERKCLDCMKPSSIEANDANFSIQMSIPVHKLFEQLLML